ncbi:MAG: flagellar protein FliT [Lachnospiraceae bacterium]|nr:flagellar protein FliT [Lachnospiraceae bacterium]
MSEDYIRILMDSLEKKISLLEKIVVLNEQQRQYFESSSTMPDELNDNIEAKGKLVDQIVALDEGFERVFAGVQQELSERREEYRDEIGTMQNNIRRISELAAKVETQEQRNRNLASSFYAGKKSKTRQVRRGTEAVNRYNQGMLRQGAINPQFMDRKK